MEIRSEWANTYNTYFRLEVAQAKVLVTKAYSPFSSGRQTPIMEGVVENVPEKLDKLSSRGSAAELFRSLAFTVDGDSDATTIFDCKKMAQHIGGDDGI